MLKTEHLPCMIVKFTTAYPICSIMKITVSINTNCAVNSLYFNGVQYTSWHTLQFFSKNQLTSIKKTTLPGLASYQLLLYNFLIGM